MFDSVMSGSPAVISSGQMLSRSGCFPSLRGVDKPTRQRRMKDITPKTCTSRRCGKLTFSGDHEII